MTTSLSRRSFLIKTGWLSAGLTCISACSPLIPPLPTTAEPETDNNLWVQMLPSGQVRFYCPRMEMGQGATIGLSQIVATELNLDQSSIECVIPNTSEVPPFKLTVGSESIEVFAKPVAIAAATLRENLKHRAAKQLNIPAGKLNYLKDGFGYADQKISYTDLTNGETQILLADSDIAVEDLLLLSFGKKSDQAIGKNWKDPNLLKIVTGQMIFSRDVSLDRMLYAEILPAPTPNAKLKEVNWGKSTSLPGVQGTIVIKEKNLIAIVTDTPFQLAEAITQVQVTWEESTPQKEKPDFDSLLRDQVREDDFEHVLLEDGKAFSLHPEQQLKASFSTPFATHAMIEPRAAIAIVDDEKVEVWCGTQDPYWMQKRIADLLSRSEDDVVIHPQRMGGSFGGRVFCGAAEEAALISNHIKKPVRVQWSRKREFQSNYYQPAFAHQITAHLSDEKKITSWKHDFVSSPIITGPVGPPLSDLIDIFAADKGTARGAISPYALDHQIIRYSDIRSHIPVGAWRGLGAAPNTFAIECMMDMLAHKAGEDPIQFRLHHLSPSDQRMKNILKEISRFSNWANKTTVNSGKGIAISYYKNKTRVAIVAHVSVHPNDRTIKVDKIYCVQDSGLVINPDQVKHQICGNVIWGCSMALKEQLNFEGGEISDENFDTYMPLTFDEAPDIDVKLLAQDVAPPLPVGESALPPVAPAIANAVFNATGKRLTHLPLKL